MKYIFLLINLIISTLFFGQETEKVIERYSNGKIKYEGIIINDTNSGFGINNNIKLINAWNEKGIQVVKKGDGFYLETISDKKTSYFLSEKGLVKNGLKEGFWVGKEKNPEFLNELISFTEKYSKGLLIEGKSLDKKKNQYVYTKKYEFAHPQEGLELFNNFVMKKFDNERLSGNLPNQLSGRVYIQFTIEKDGSLSEFKILRDLGFDIGLEIIRVLKTYSSFNPGKYRGKSLTSKITFPFLINISN